MYVIKKNGTAANSALPTEKIDRWWEDANLRPLGHDNDHVTTIRHTRNHMYNTTVLAEEATSFQ